MGQVGEAEMGRGASRPKFFLQQNFWTSLSTPECKTLVFFHLCDANNVGQNFAFFEF